MKLKKKLNLLQEYVDKTPQLEDSEDIVSINEETEAYKKGFEKGKAFQAAVVLAVVVFIAIRRAKIRLKKKQAYYMKQKPKREKMVADKKIVKAKYSAEEGENIKQLVGKLQDKVKTEVKKKKAAYAAKTGKTQGELQGDKTLANLDKVRDEKLKKIEDAVKEKLKQKQDKEQIDLDRKIEDWDRKWKKLTEKWDPSELFNKIAGKKGLGGVVAAWDQWKIEEDRKIYDKTLKYELKQLREYVEKDEDIKAIMQDREERKKKMEEEWKKQGISIEERLKKSEELEKELEEEEGELKNEFPDLPDAKEAKAALDESLSQWGITYEALQSQEAITISQKEELQGLAKESGKAMTAMTDKYYEAITGGKDYSELKEADKAHKDALDKGQKEFLGKVKIKATEEEIEKIKEELDDSTKELNDIQGTDDPDGKEILRAELTILQKKESLATAEGNEKARKTLVQSIEDKEKEIEEYKEPQDTEENEKDNNSYNMKVTKRLKSLNEWRSVFENEPLPQPQEAPRPNDRNKVEVDVKEPTPDLSSEIDIILNKLKDLENNLEEDLKIIKREELNEAGAAAVGGAAVDFIKDFMKSRKVKSSQVKANGIKMQKAKADIQKGEVEPAKKEKLKKQIDKFKESIDKIEGTIDQMADGPMSKRVKNTYRIQGNMEVAKVLAKGGRDNKKQIAKLNKKLKDEVAATKKLADENKDAIAKMKKDQAAKKDSEAKKDTPKKEPEVKKEPKDKKKEIEDKANKAMDKEKADAKAAGDKAKADAKAKDSKKVDDAPAPPSKEKQKAAADKINKQSDKKIKAAGDDQKKSIKDTEAKMKKQTDDALKKGKKDIEKNIGKKDTSKKSDTEETPKKKKVKMKKPLKTKGKSKVKI